MDFTQQNHVYHICYRQLPEMFYNFKMFVFIFLVFISAYLPNQVPQLTAEESQGQNESTTPHLKGNNLEFQKITFFVCVCCCCLFSSPVLEGQ